MTSYTAWQQNDVYVWAAALALLALIMLLSGTYGRARFYCEDHGRDMRRAGVARTTVLLCGIAWAFTGRDLWHERLSRQSRTR